MSAGSVGLALSAIGPLLAFAVLAACNTATGPAGLPTASCDAAGRVAAGPHASVKDDRQLDPMLWDCRSIHDLEAAGSKYAEIFSGRDPVTVATARCNAPDGPRTSNICVRLFNGDYSEGVSSPPDQ